MGCDEENRSAADGLYGDAAPTSGEESSEHPESKKGIINGTIKGMMPQSSPVGSLHITGLLLQYANILLPVIP